MEAWLETVIESFVAWGYWGLFISAFVAGSVLPFSSEVVMVVLVRMGLNPGLCILAATLGNTAGGMTCYWIGHLGNTKWINKLGVNDQKLAKAEHFLHGRGALMGFFAFLPYIGEAIAIGLGLMRSNLYLTMGSMFIGKLLRYVAIYAAFQGAASLF
ncbi:MAG: YqaA family protein [Alistipes sp.]